MNAHTTTAAREYFESFSGDTAHDDIVFDPPRRLEFDVEAAIADRDAMLGVGRGEFLRDLTHVDWIFWNGDDNEWRVWLCTADNSYTASLAMRFVSAIDGFDLRAYK